jgi:hypothetical protein
MYIGKGLVVDAKEFFVAFGCGGKAKPGKGENDTVGVKALANGLQILPVTGFHKATNTGFVLFFWHG